MSLLPDEDRKDVTILVQNFWCKMIMWGEKTIELRPSPLTKFTGVHTLVIENEKTGDRHPFKLVKVTHYPNLLSALTFNDNWQKCAPQSTSLVHAVNEYKKVKMVSRGEDRDGAPAGEVVEVFSEERIDLRGGICALEIEPLSSD